MSRPNWNDDDDLALELSQALHSDAIEQQVVEAARAARRWRASDPDAELAQLLFDSDVDRSALVRNGHAEPRRTLLFGSGPRQVEIELGEDGIEGQLIPPEQALVLLVTIAGESVQTTADAVGCFTFPGPHSGPVRLEWTVAGDRLVTTWIATSSGQPTER